MIIRNDDVAADTTLHEIRTFCEICDHYGVTPMHAITPLGRVRGIECSMSNPAIRLTAGADLFAQNVDIFQFLKRRPSDQIAVHGLWHTHQPTEAEVTVGRQLLEEWGFAPVAYVPPFNECDAPGWGGLPVIGKGVPRLEEFLEGGDPGAEVVYLHSWRFEHGPFTWEQLDRCLKRLTRT